MQTDCKQTVGLSPGFSDSHVLCTLCSTVLVSAQAMDLDLFVLLQIPACIALQVSRCALSLLTTDTQKMC